MTDDKVLVVKNLCKDFANQRVISSLSFSIQRKDQVALFAPSGAGKTTLINILAGLEPATSGCFEMDKDFHISIIFQEPRLFSFMTIEENILLPFRIKKLTPSNQDLEHYHQWLDVCELFSNRHQYPHQLSGGMKQKASLIRGFLSNPDFVLMDEPFQSIDEVSKRKIVRHIKRSYPELTSLFITHSPDEVPMLAKTVLYFFSHNLSAPVCVDADIFKNVFFDYSFQIQRI